MQQPIAILRSLSFSASTLCSSTRRIGLPPRTCVRLAAAPPTRFSSTLRVLTGIMSVETKSPARLIVLSGPSGVGKSTIKDRLLAEHPDKFEFSVSHTTRLPRPKGQTAGSDGAPVDVLERDGEDYWFVPAETFEAMIAKDEFVEHAVFGRNRYGTSKAAIQKIADAGRVCLLDIEMEGVKQIRASALPARFLFVAPPSLDVLEARLRGRATDSEDAILRRLAQAKAELAYAETTDAHDRIVVNDDLETAYQEVKAFCLEGCEK